MKNNYIAQNIPSPTNNKDNNKKYCVNNSTASDNNNNILSKNKNEVRKGGFQEIATKVIRYQRFELMIINLLN